MYNNINIESVLFLDIETVPVAASYDKLPEPLKLLWKKKSEQLVRFDHAPAEEQKTPEMLYERAGIYSEFGKIVCISTGTFRNGTFWVKSFSGDDEKQILLDFNATILKAFTRGGTYQYLCAHNGKEFDFPYLTRRMLIHGIPVPAILDRSEKKPWELNLLDTMEMWKFGDYKNFTSLELLATIFNIPTPKDDIDGSDVARVFWVEKDLPRIVTYCQKDVITIASLLLRFQGKEIISENQVQIV